MSPYWLIPLIAVTVISLPIGQGTNNVAAVAAVVFFVSGLVLYLWPSLVATTRRHHNITGVVLVNLFLGWTVLGWVVAVVWSYSTGIKVVTTDAAPTNAASPQRVCPYCAEEIRPQAIKCKHCGSDVSLGAVGAATGTE